MRELIDTYGRICNDTFLFTDPCLGNGILARTHGSTTFDVATFMIECSQSFAN